MLLGPTSTPEAQRAKLRESARALESLVLKDLIKASKAFTGGDGAGSAIRADLFANTLADAMVKGGGIGLAAQIERSVAPPPAPASPGLGGPAPDAPTSTPPAAPAGVAPRLMRAGTTTSSTAPAEDTRATAADTSATAAGVRVTSPFGMRRDPFDGHLTRHEGVDLASPDGAQVYAVAGGVVRQAGPRGGYGNAVEIDHGDGHTTLYAHLSDVVVKAGDQVASGQTIAHVGHSGRATGPHLHFEVRQGNRPVDPSKVLKIYAARADEGVGRGS